MNNLSVTAPLTALCLSFLQACAFAPPIGENPSDTPPQLIAGSQRDASGRVLYEWDRPGAFGKVTGLQKVFGDAACLMGRADLEAVGYHPFAKDANGQPIPGGGYFCRLKDRGDKPSAQAPMLVKTNGVLGWDQPSLFGAVPKEHKLRGDAVCEKAQPGYEAVAYHPAAKDEKGEPIFGGGFFCAPQKNSAIVIG